MTTEIDLTATHAQTIFTIRPLLSIDSWKSPPGSISFPLFSSSDPFLTLLNSFNPFPPIEFLFPMIVLPIPYW
jgi:hypothetical protein